MARTAATVLLNGASSCAKLLNTALVCARSGENVAQHEAGLLCTVYTGTYRAPSRLGWQIHYCSPLCDARYLIDRAVSIRISIGVPGVITIFLAPKSVFSHMPQVRSRSHSSFHPQEAPHGHCSKATCLTASSATTGKPIKTCHPRKNIGNCPHEAIFPTYCRFRVGELSQRSDRPFLFLMPIFNNNSNLFHITFSQRP